MTHKPISELNYEEAAMLAALPKAPSKYNPYKNMELAKFRRNLVLKNLYDNSYLTNNNLVLENNVITRPEKIDDFDKKIIEEIKFLR